MDADAVTPLPAPRPGDSDWQPGPGVRRAVGCLLALLVVLGVVLRFAARSDLWLDEALTVNIAHLPLDHLRAALVRDGAPPLYYVLLHGWMAVFGTSTAAVRALSGILGVLGIALAGWAGVLVGGSGRRARQVGAVAAVVVATSPFAIRYATETRMYELTTVLVLAGVVAVARAWAEPRVSRLALVAVVTGALLLTQYWAFFLVATTVAGLVAVAARARGDERGRAGRVLAAIGVGCLTFVPWLPTLRTQLAHTGTPWDTPTTPTAGLRRAVVGLAGEGSWRWPLTILTVIVLVAALVAPTGTGSIPGRSVRVLVALALGTLVSGVLVSWLTDAGFQTRYAAVAFPVMALALAAAVVTVGVAVTARGGTRAGWTAAVATLVVIGVVGIVSGTHDVRAERTASTAVAAVLRPQLRADDVVAYCPDQLGPSTARLVPAGTRQVTFPTGSGPTFVDWTDYADRNAHASPNRFARTVLAGAATGRVFLVWSGGYRTFGHRCEDLVNALTRLRPRAVAVAVADGPGREQVGVRRFDP